MGLDSVEIIMDIENYFQISIPDSEAEKVTTVQQMVDMVARYLNVTDHSFELRDTVFGKVNLALVKLKITNAPIELIQYISKYLSPENTETWNSFENELRLCVPKPLTAIRKWTKIFDKIISAQTWTPLNDWQTVTIEQFTTAICANNHNELLDPIHIKSTYEIYVAVTAITVDKIGVEYYEITPEKSFTSDLGID